jgi:hypothetical protein
MKKNICKKISLTDYYTSQAKAITVTTILILVWNGIMWVVDKISDKKTYLEVDGDE